MYAIPTTGTGGLGVGDVFQLFRDGRGRTKSELASITGLSRNTVASRVDALLDVGLLAPAGAEESSGGRPAARIAMNASADAALAIDLGATHATVAVTDLAANILAIASEPTRIGDGPIPVLEQVFELGTRLLASAAPNRRLAGVGIGLPGPVDYSTGRPVNPPLMPSWDGFDVPAFVRRRFPAPVLVDNDVNILAIGEQALTWPDSKDLIFVKVATGLGAGIIAGGQLQRGIRGASGDIGHVQVPYSRDSPREPGDESILAALASGSSLAAQLSALGLPSTSSADVVRLAQSGEPRAVKAVRQAGREVGEVLAILVNALNPSIIVVGGSIARAGDHLLAGVREVVYRRSEPLSTESLQVVSSRAGDRAGVLGAAILIIQEILAANSVDEFVAAGGTWNYEDGSRREAWSAGVG